MGYFSAMDGSDRAAIIPPGIDRRGFLRSTAGGGLAIALASLLPGCGRSANAQDAGDLRSLTEAEYETVRAAAEALLAGGPRVDPASIARRIDYELWAVGGAIEEDMRTVLQLLERLTFLGGRARRFSELDPQERLTYLHTWRDSRFNLRRASFNAVKSFIYFFSYSDPSTWQMTRFPGPWPGRVNVPVPPVDFGEIA
ncbi:MAG TPA: hypothetical protein VF039_03680 [Longimicrobiales bacterium]